VVFFVFGTFVHAVFSWDFSHQVYAADDSKILLIIIIANTVVVLYWRAIICFFVFFRPGNIRWIVDKIQHAGCTVRRQSISRISDDHSESLPTSAASERLHIYGRTRDYDCWKERRCPEDIPGWYYKVTQYCYTIWFPWSQSHLHW